MRLSCFGRGLPCYHITCRKPCHHITFRKPPGWPHTCFFISTGSRQVFVILAKNRC